LTTILTVLGTGEEQAMTVIIEVLGAAIVAFVAVARSVIQVVRWIWRRGYEAGKSDAYREAESAAQARVANEVQALRKLLGGL
jgi:hypothetical protein